MKKGDKQFDVGYGQGGGGGMGGAYKGPTGGGSGDLRQFKQVMREIRASDTKQAIMDNYLKKLQSEKISESSISRAPKIDKPMGAVAIGAAAAAGAGVVAKKRKDAEKTEAYRRKPRMADAPPKINIRKAYEE